MEDIFVVNGDRNVPKNE